MNTNAINMNSMNMNAMFHPQSEIPEMDGSEMGVKIVSHNPFNGNRPGSAARTLKVR